MAAEIPSRHSNVVPMAVLLGVALMVFCLAVTRPSSAQEGDQSQLRPQYTEDGSETCLFCHSDQRMRLISDTAHGNAANPNSPAARQGCEACHGPGSLHATRSRRGKGRPAMIAFGVDTGTPHATQAKACLNCHGREMGELTAMEWQGSTHSNEDLACSSCHKLHAPNDVMEDRQTQAEACYACHGDAKSSHPNFEAQGIVLEKLSCWDCHDVHQLLPGQ